MGQTTSSTDHDLRRLQGLAAANLNVFKSLATVTYKEVIDLIEELNTVTKSFTDKSGKQLKFVKQSGSDKTILWKGTIRIKCLKVNTRTNLVESSLSLTLRQFILMYKEIMEKVAILSKDGDDRTHPDKNDEPGTSNREEFTTSSFFPHLEKETSHTDMFRECCVCMDRKACVMLSCLHEFCEICIDSWTSDERHRNCPLCRSCVEGTDDTWVLTDKTEAKDYEGELKGYLVGLADRSPS